MDSDSTKVRPGSSPAILDAIPEALVVTDLEFRIVNVNRGFTRLTGLTLAQVAGQNPRVLAFEAPSTEDADALREALATGRSWYGRFHNRRQIAGQSESWWAAATITPLLGDDGAVTGYVSVQRDVSAAVVREDEETHAREAAELKAVVGRIMAEHSPLKSRVARVVETLASMTGAEWQDKAGFFVVNHDAGQLEMVAHHGSYSEDFLRREQRVAMGSCLCGRAAVSGELIVSDDCFEDPRHEHQFEGMQAHGHYIVPAVADGVVQGVLFLYTDPYPNRGSARLELLRRVGELLALALLHEAARIELLNAREEALRVAQAQAVFLANMSHEIRTPMSGILGMVELLGDTPLEDAQAEMLGAVRSSAETLLCILNDILDVSKIEAGGMTVESIDVDLRAVLEDVGELLVPQAARKGLELAVEVDPSLPQRVKGDPVRLRQVITNLGSNAIKFTQRGEVVLSVRAERELEGSVVVRFAVRDTGLGIPADRQDAIFEVFAQADDATTRNFGGSGLGLSICRQLTELMGGSIGVSSAPGEGSTFHVTMAMARVDKPEPVQRARMGGRVVLVVSDSATQRAILRAQLESWGCRVREVRSGPRALTLLERLDTRHWDLAVVDQQLPGMSGLELATCLREHANWLASPVLLLSSDGAPTDALQRRHHVAAALAKPVRQERLRKALERVLGIVAPAPVPASVPASAPAQAQSSAQVQAPAPALAPAAAVQRPGPERVDLSVLLVEDNLVNQKVAGMMLSRSGCRVTVANDGVEGVEAAAQGGFDLILMDVQMPRLDGIEATRRIRAVERAAGASPVPIIALSAHVLEAERSRCLEAGMDAHLAKPIVPKELAALLASTAARRAPASLGGSCGDCTKPC
ncbi:MAG: histidine kinase [Planctomycetota bacterium]|nr:MAG: histidine kinase [Planctomycetota bacterium]